MNIGNSDKASHKSLNDCIHMRVQRGEIQKWWLAVVWGWLAGNRAARKVIAKGYGVSWHKNVLKLTGDCCTCLHILKAIESYTLNGCIVWYVNYIPKLVFEKMQVLPKRKCNWSIHMKMSSVTSQKNESHARFPLVTPQIHNVLSVTVPAAGEDVRHLCGWNNYLVKLKIGIWPSSSALRCIP